MMRYELSIVVIIIIIIIITTAVNMFPHGFRAYKI